MTKFAPWFLIAIGCVQMVGDFFGLPAVKAVGAASIASPAPKVFTAHEGFETYSSQFILSWTDRKGVEQHLQLTPERYAGVRGPYNRRNAYGAALSYAPVLHSNELSRPMLDAAIQHTFCGNSSALEEIGIDRAEVAGPYHFRLLPRQELPDNHPWKLEYKVTCDAE